MQCETQISNRLHDEHLTTIEFLEKFESELIKNKFNQIPDIAGTDLSLLLRQMIALIETELTIHFQFEEESLFPLLDIAGDIGITTLLTDEHQVITQIGEQLVELGKQALTNGFTDETWPAMRRQGLELVERLVAHIQKEEMGLLPMLDTVIEDEQDVELTDAYALMH